MAETADTEMLPGAEEALEWTGFRLDEMGGAGVGKVQGILVDEQSGEPAWVVAKLGRFGKVIAVPFRDCAAGAGNVWVPHQRDVVRGAPALDGGKPLTREEELQICEHYGIREDQGRAAEVSGRPEGAETAQPPAAPPTS
ncbi:MAG: PRC-barrel domain-containing protein [Actinomycetota bacterium]